MVSNLRSSIVAFIDENLSPAARSKLLAATAIAERNKLIQSGQASRRFSTFVDGRRDDGGEAHVKGSGGGVINYKFSFIGDVIEFALAFLRVRVPRVSGKLSEKFWVSINDQYIPPGTGVDYASIPSDAFVVIGNTSSYWRKVEVNRIGITDLKYRAPNELKDCVSAIGREFGTSVISARRVYDYVFPGKYKPVTSPTRMEYIYTSPVIIISEVK